MKKLTLSILALALTVMIAAPAMAGNCDNPSDSAADGSRCGGRAASERPGGSSGGLFEQRYSR